jgi:methionine-rich copper-binding protein CopC
MNRAVRVLAAVALFTGALSLTLGLTPSASYGHTELTESLPGNDAVLGTMPARVLLTFTDLLDPARIQLDVIGPDRASAIAGPVSVRGHTAQQPVKAGPNGKYIVTYEVVSADTHVVKGSLTFTLRPGAPPAPSEPSIVVAPSGSPAPTATGKPGRATAVPPAATGGGSTDGGGSTWWWWTIPLVAGSAGAGVFLVLSRRGSAPTADTASAEPPPATTPEPPEPPAEPTEPLAEPPQPPEPPDEDDPK